jgi:signal transduction histidine kinase/DNA-binding NarL/FixJ family response regulator
MSVESGPIPSESSGAREQELEKLAELFMRTTREIGSHLDYDRTLEAAARIPLGLIGDWAGLVLFDEEGSARLVHIRHRDPQKQEVLSRQSAEHLSMHLERLAMYLRECRLRCEPIVLPLSCFSSDANEAFHAVEGEQNAFAFPIQEKHEVKVLLLLGKTGPDRFTPQEIQMGEEFARRVGVALAHASLFFRYSKVERELVDAKRRAEIANQTKNHFFAMISHEIRTPLTAILGFSDLLISERAPYEEQLDWAKRIRQNGQHLLRLIEDMLTLTRGEAGKFQYELSELSVGDFLSGLESTYRGSLQAKGLRFAIHREPGVPERFITDATRFNQILSNLIGNAIKFTDHGGIDLHVRFEPQHRFLIIAVSDTGRGLTPQQASRLFTPFSQAEAAHGSRLGGTGLGLALIRQLARGLGGDVEILRTAPGTGTTFQVSLPIEAAARLKPTSGSAATALAAEQAKKDEHDHRDALEEAVAPLQGKKILLVDDSIDNQALMVRHLNKAGAEVVTAANGLEAIEKALSIRPMLVLMDIQMPEMNGDEATRILRVRGFERPIIALTAHSDTRSIENCLAAGCDAYLMKPVSSADLIEGVLAWTASTAGGGSADDPVCRPESKETMGNFLGGESDRGPEDHAKRRRDLNESFVSGEDWAREKISFR